jgi:hypothetical protein
LSTKGLGSNVYKAGSRQQTGRQTDRQIGTMCARRDEANNNNNEGKRRRKIRRQ